MASFIDFPIETDEDALIEDFQTSMEEFFPGWEPNPGDLEDWISRIWARMAVETAELAADVPGEIFYQFGEKILDIPPISASSAVTTTTWTFISDEGYTVEEGTQLSIRVSGNQSFGFEVLEDFSVPIGETTIENVLIQALEPGSYAEGIEGPVGLIDAIPGVETIILEAPASGGSDSEDPDDYLDRLATETRLLSPRPILAKDVEALARRIPTVVKTLALDLYDPDLDTWDNEKTTSVAVATAEGLEVSSIAKAAVGELLSKYREQNYQFHVLDPTYTFVKVKFEVTSYTGFLQEDVEANCILALEDYLSPAKFGNPGYLEDPTVWERTTSVYRNELIALLDRVQGVDRVISVELAEEGNSYGISDVPLDGPAPLPKPGTIEVV